MCLAIPSRIVELDELNAVVDVMGARRTVNLMLMPEDIRIGDFVLVHAGFAIQKVEEGPAQESLRLIGELLHELEKDSRPPDDGTHPS